MWVLYSTLYSYVADLARKIPELAPIAVEIGSMADTEMSGGTAEVLLCDALYRAWRILALGAVNPKPSKWDANVSHSYSPMDCIPHWQDQSTERPTVHDFGKFLLAALDFANRRSKAAKDRPKLTDAEFLVSSIFSHH